MEKNFNNIEELLLVVDMVNGFVVEGPMADPYIQTIVPPIRREMIKFIKDNKKAVAIVKEDHDDNSIEFKSYPEHCKRKTKEAEIVDGLKDLEKYCQVFLKNSTSAIWAPGFMEMIKQLIKNPNFKRVIITGCCTDICIMNLAIPLKMFFNQFNIDVEVMIPENAVETFNIPGVHERKHWNEMAIQMMKQAGIKIYNSDYLELENILTRYGVDRTLYSLGDDTPNKLSLVKLEHGYRINNLEYTTFEEAGRELIKILLGDNHEAMQELKKIMGKGYQKIKKKEV